MQGRFSKRRAVASAVYCSVQIFRWWNASILKCVHEPCLCRICSLWKMPLYRLSGLAMLLHHGVFVMRCNCYGKCTSLAQKCCEMVNRRVSGGFSGGQRPAESFSVIGFLRLVSSLRALNLWREGKQGMDLCVLCSGRDANIG